MGFLKNIILSVLLKLEVFGNMLSAFNLQMVAFSSWREWASYLKFLISSSALKGPSFILCVMG